jgi:formaldehyde-activating enzyme involved in methanogenesis
MSLGAIIKRHKRTLINFQESFLLPFVQKAAYRYMQFEPELYPVKDYKFNATSSLGIIAREYEVTQLVQLLQTMQQDSPLYPVLIQSIIDNMNLSNREELIATMKQASQPNPEAQQMQQAQMQAQMAFQEAQTATLQAQAQEAMARAQKYSVESQMLPQELEIDKLKAVTTNIREGENDDKEFERRLKIADMLLKEKQVSLQEQSMSAKKVENESSKAMEQQLMQRLMPRES